MTKKPLSPEEQARRQTFAFNAEAARAGMFAAAMDMLETMREGGVVENEAPLLTGMLEASVQLWASVMLAAGQSPKAAREALLGQVQFFWNKHRHPAETQDAVAS